MRVCARVPMHIYRCICAHVCVSVHGSQFAGCTCDVSSVISCPYAVALFCKNTSGVVQLALVEWHYSNTAVVFGVSVHVILQWLHEFNRGLVTIIELSVFVSICVRVCVCVCVCLQPRMCDPFTSLYSGFVRLIEIQLLSLSFADSANLAVSAGLVLQLILVSFLSWSFADSAVVHLVLVQFCSQRWFTYCHRVLQRALVLCSQS